MHRHSTFRCRAARVIALAALSSAPSVALADFTYDLRFSDGTKSKVVTETGLYTIDLWAQLTEEDGNWSDDALSYGVLSIVSKQIDGGAITSGGITSGSPTSKFTVPAQTFTGDMADLNGDGILDRGTNNRIENGSTLVPKGSIRWLSSEWTDAGVRGTVAGTPVAGLSQQVDAHTWEWRVARYYVSVDAINQGEVVGKTQFLPVFPQGSFQDLVDTSAVGFYQDDPRINEGSPAVQHDPRSVGTPLEFVMEGLILNDSQILLKSGTVHNTSTGLSQLTVDAGNLLLNGSFSTSFELEKHGDSPGGFQMIGPSTLSAVSTPPRFDAGDGTASVAVVYHPDAYGPAAATLAIHNTATVSSSAGRGSNDADDRYILSANVGIAQAPATFAPANALWSAVAAGSSYSGLSSKTVAGPHVAGSEAVILGGSSSASRAVSMNWRARSAAELDRNRFGAGAPGELVSDVAQLAGFEIAGGAAGGNRTQSDIYVLSMSYDPAGLRGGTPAETPAAIAGQLRLGRLDWQGAWVDAASSNFSGTTAFAGTQAFADAGSPGLADDLGRWGIDTEHHTVWAVLDYSSSFAVLSAIPGAMLTWSATAENADSDGVWSASGRTWTSGGTRTIATTADDVAFGAATGTGQVNVSIDQPTLVHSLTFNAASPTYRLSGQGLTLTAGITANADAAIDAPVRLAVPQDWSVASGRTLAIAGPISGALLNKTGSGTLALTGGSNTHAGTRIEAGTVQLGSPGALGPSVILAGGTLAPMSDLELATPLAIESAGGMIHTAGKTFTFAGPLSGPGDLIKAGDGVLKLTGVSTRTGTTTVTGGTLSITSEAQLGSASGPLTISGGTLAVDAEEEYPTLSLPVVIGPGGATFKSANFLVFSSPISGSGNIRIDAGSEMLVAGGGRWGDMTVDGRINLSGPTEMEDLTVNPGAIVYHNGTAAMRDVHILPGGHFSEIIAHLTVRSMIIEPGGSFYVGDPLHSSLTFLDPTGGIVNNGQIEGPTDDVQEVPGNIRGGGSFKGNIALPDTYSPGNSPAIILADNLYFESSSTLKMELGGLAPGTGYDQIRAAGSLTLAGTLQLDLVNGFVPQPGETFQLFDAPLIGSFDHYTLPPLPGGMSFDTSRLASQGLITVVPEPGAALLGLSLAGLLLRRRVRP